MLMNTHPANKAMRKKNSREKNITEPEKKQLRHKSRNFTDGP